MEEKEMRGFSVINLLFVTGICCLAFTGIMKWLDNSIIRVFLYTGITSLGLGIFGFLGKLLIKKWDGARTPLKNQDNQLF